MHDQESDSTGRPGGLRPRTVVKGSAWSVPAVLAVQKLPAVAASPAEITYGFFALMQHNPFPFFTGANTVIYKSLKASDGTTAPDDQSGAPAVATILRFTNYGVALPGPVVLTLAVTYYLGYYSGATIPGLGLYTIAGGTVSERMETPRTSLAHTVDTTQAVTLPSGIPAGTSDLAIQFAHTHTGKYPSTNSQWPLPLQFSAAISAGTYGPSAQPVALTKNGFVNVAFTVEGTHV